MIYRKNIWKTCDRKVIARKSINFLKAMFRISEGRTPTELLPSWSEGGQVFHHRRSKILQVSNLCFSLNHISWGSICTILHLVSGDFLY
jgi:hypothetical protein